jgi:signal transduction histidine kinase
MNYPILSTRISEATMATLRGRTRQIAEHFGLDTLQTTRFVTAVSEIGRNAVTFAGEGAVAFSLAQDAGDGGQRIVAVISDKGPGIADVQGALEGRPTAKGKLPLGIVGSRRLVDALRIDSTPGAGASVTIEMALPRTAPRLSAADLGRRVEELARQRPRTPLEELEKQNHEMLGTLQELRLRQLDLETADQRKNQFLATLAHELRNPLGTLHMMLEIMKRNLRIEPEDLGRRRDAMARQTEQMTKLVEDLLDVSRVSQGKVTMDHHPLELNELVRQAVEMTGSAIASKNLKVAVRHHEEELWLSGDASRLKQVLGNLIHNATRYTPDGGDITINVRREGGSALLEVSDTGIGIPADMLPHVFELFVQGDAGPNRAGLGIGLTLVRKLVEGHGGAVTASSAGAGQGSQFVVTLPLQ